MSEGWFSHIAALLSFLFFSQGEMNMPCFSLIDHHLSVWYNISWVSRVLHFHMFLMTETIKPKCQLNNARLWISKGIQIGKLTRNPHKKFFNIKHNEVAQNRFQNLHLRKKLIKLHIVNGFLCQQIKTLRLYYSTGNHCYQRKVVPR